MKKGRALLFFILGFTQILSSWSQETDSISLFECYKLVRGNAPQIGLLDIHSQSAEIEIEKLSKKNLPQVSAYGKAWYQSDAITMSLPIPGVGATEIDRFQYNAGVNLEQKIFDGGLNQIQKEIKSIESEIGQLETEVALYKLNELVNNYFFGIARLKESTKILDLKMELLKERKKILNSRVQNGMILQTELDRIQAEIIQTEQQFRKINLESLKLDNGLSILTNRKNKETTWVTPSEIITEKTETRFETELFEVNRSYIKTLQGSQGKKYLPQINGYGQAGCSYPGLNFFENQSDVYYIVGAKLSWRIFDWSEGKKEKQLLELKNNQINISEANFNRNLNLSIENQLAEIQLLQDLITSDEQIILAKQKLTKSSASLLDNGTITSVEYLSDLNAELNARIDSAVHRVQLTEAKAKLAILKGIHIQ